VPPHARCALGWPSQHSPPSCSPSAPGSASSIAILEHCYVQLLLEGFGLLAYFVGHQGEHYLLVVLQVVLDELVEFCLLRLAFLLLLLFLHIQTVTYWKIYLCYLALDLTFSREVSLRLTLSTFLTVFSSLFFM